jgi:hypothetical protein
LDLVEHRDGIALVRTGDVLVAVWKLAATRERFDWLTEHLRTMADRWPSFVVLQLIMSSSSPPDAPLRARVRAVMRELDGRMRFLVSVPLGDALWMTIVRTIMRGLTVISGQTGRTSVASTVSQGLDHVAAVAREATPTRDELIDAILAVLAALDVERREIGV